MKIQTGHIRQQRDLRDTAEARVVPIVVNSFRETLALLGAVSVAITIVMLSVRVIGSPMQAAFSALTWGAGLVFLAMALDNRAPTALLQVITGLGLMFLAWLQNAVSADLSVVTGILIALWSAASLFQRLK